jgi:hypothetical protein
MNEHDKTQALKDFKRWHAADLKRIAELEAELATLRASHAAQIDAIVQTRSNVEKELAALTEKCGKCPICNPGQRNLCGDESGAARVEEESEYCEEDIANSDRPLG